MKKDEVSAPGSVFLVPESDPSHVFIDVPVDLAPSPSTPGWYLGEHDRRRLCSCERKTFQSEGGLDDRDGFFAKAHDLGQKVFS